MITNYSLPIEYLFVLATIYPSIKNKKYIFEGGYTNYEFLNI